jgi:hypothetical protein
LPFIRDSDYDRINDGDELSVDNIRSAVETGTVTVRNVTQGYDFMTSGK